MVLSESHDRADFGLTIFDRANKMFSPRTAADSVVCTDATPTTTNTAALAAKQRFRQQQQKQQREQPEKRVALAVDFTQSLDLCPNCSLPLLHQDVAMCKEGKSNIVLCHSSSSGTTQTLGNDPSTTMGTSMEDFTLNDFDTRSTPLNPARVSKSMPYEMTAPNCGFMLPMVSLLEQFVGSYCDSVCADQVMASKDKKRFDEIQAQNKARRQVPPYCANCKSYVVQEPGDGDKQDELLTNLASWLASASSSDDGTQEEGKISKVAFRPLHGSITVILDKTTREQKTGTYASTSEDSLTRREKLQRLPPKSPAPSSHYVVIEDSEPMEWDALMQRRTPRIGIIPRINPPSSPGSPAIQDRYLVDVDYESSPPERPRSPSRRQKYMSLLDDCKEDTDTTQNVLPVPRLSVDPSPRYPPQPREHNIVERDLSSPTSTSVEQDFAISSGDEGFMKAPEHQTITTVQLPIPKFLTNETKKVEMKVMDILSLPSRHLLAIDDVQQGDPTQTEESPPTRLELTAIKTVEVNDGGTEEKITNHDTPPTTDDDNGSVGTCYTLKEEANIIKDYEEKREIATKAIGRRLMEGYILTQTQCDHCQMPVMELNGVNECVVCPLVSKKAKKRADLIRMGQAIMDTFDSESPPKRKHERKPVHEEQNSMVNYRNSEIGQELEAVRHFEELKEQAQAENHQRLEGLLINWAEEEQFDETEGKFSPNSDYCRNEGQVDQEICYTMHSTQVGEEARDELNSECSGSDVYDMEIGSQEVYRRLLNGWLLTNSTCPQCLAPLMQSTTGGVECVVCSNKQSEPSTTRGLTDGGYSDRQSKLVTNRDYQEDERTSSENLRTTNESIDRESSLNEKPLIHSFGNGWRYLAIPENLDMDDHEALLSFLTESKRKPRASTEKVGMEVQATTNHHQAVFHNVRNTRGPRDAYPRIADSEATVANFAITKTTNSTNISIARSHGNEIFLPSTPESLQVFDLTAQQSPSEFEKTRRSRSMVSDDGLRLVKSDSYRENGPDNGFRSISADAEVHQYSFHDQGMSVPVGGDKLSVGTSKVAPQSYPKDSVHKFQLSKGESGSTFSSYATRGSGSINRDSKLYQEDFSVSNRSDTASRSASRLDRLSFGRSPSDSREIVLKEHSPGSETGAVFADFPDDNDLILVFESSKSYPSDELTRRSASLSPSPRRPRRQKVSDDPSYRFQSASQSCSDYIVHHSIKSNHADMEARCQACSNPLRSGTAVCENPRCAVYMIPVENIDIFTSTMKEDSEGARRSYSYERDHMNDLSVANARGFSSDMMRWKMHAGNDRLSQRGDSDKYNRHGKASPLVSFSEDIESRVSSVDSFKSVTSDAVNALLSRMSGSRKSLAQNFPKNQEAKTDMAVLIDRLASAAVAIKDLEQSVHDAEESSPQRTFLGRPPTSPRTRSPFRDSRWF